MFIQSPSLKLSGIGGISNITGLPELLLLMALLLLPVELQVERAKASAARGEFARARNAQALIVVAAFVITLMVDSFVEMFFALMLAMWSALPVAPKTKSFC